MRAKIRFGRRGDRDIPSDYIFQDMKQTTYEEPEHPIADKKIKKCG